MQDEKKEHIFLSEMLEVLELGFSQDVPMDAVDEEEEYFDDRLEHTILDQLLLDWDIDTADTVGEKSMLATSDNDAGHGVDNECILSVKCTGDCTVAGCSQTSVSTGLEYGRNECKRSVQCAGDCTV